MLGGAESGQNGHFPQIPAPCSAIFRVFLVFSRVFRVFLPHRVVAGSLGRRESDGKRSFERFLSFCQD